MKRLAAILIAAAASAHAQFAVMHTNGVVTSPTNLTIQQSNVAGLASALDSKLGTNPTLAISNTAGLQLALDGKLATNGTLAVSNVSGLQSALDGKLATNGSAAGLSGFVGTTNAETARGNLGISNTFAGQFHADFYDDFSRYSNGTAFTNGKSPLIGSNYVLRFGQSNELVPTIVNGTLTETNNGVWYLSSELSRPVYNFGGEWTWEAGKNRFGSWPVFIVRPNDAWLQNLLHVVVTPQALNIDVSTNGAGEFITIKTQSFGNTILESGVRHTLSGEIDGDTVRVRIGGKNVEVTHPLVSEVTGRFFTFESFLPTPADTNQHAAIYWHRAWANAPTMMTFAAQPYSESLFDFANGDAQVTRYLTVGTNKSNYYNDLSSSNPVIVDGGAIFRGTVRGIAGASTGILLGAMQVAEKDYATTNANTTNLTDLSVMTIAGGMLVNNGSRWQATYVGSFAANTNNKRVVLDGGGGTLDTGSITDQGEWKTDVIIYKSTNNSHEGFAMFISENTTKTARWTFNVGSQTTFNVALQGAATSNNEVILRGAWADWYP
jgi:hypothetical protein